MRKNRQRTEKRNINMNLITARASSRQRADDDNKHYVGDHAVLCQNDMWRLVLDFIQSRRLCDKFWKRTDLQHKMLAKGLLEHGNMRFNARIRPTDKPNKWTVRPGHVRLDASTRGRVIMRGEHQSSLGTVWYLMLRSAT